MAPYGVVLVHELTAQLRLFLIVYNCHLTCPVGVNLSKPGLILIPSLPGPADWDSDQGQTVSLSDLVLNLTVYQCLMQA